MNAPTFAQTIATAVPAAVEHLLMRAAKRIQMLSALTPHRAHEERARLVADVRVGKKASPRWVYAPMAHDELRRALDASERELGRMAEPLRTLYVDRVRELSLEAALCASAGRSDVGPLARQRFSRGDEAGVRAAERLCQAWLAEAEESAPGPAMNSDDPAPGSLLSRMRRAVGRLRLPFAVVVEPSLAPLAATGERAILVAAGRPVYEEDAVRTVLHEIEGHASPRARSSAAPFALLRVGTAGGADDQEGRALVLEERAGLLGRRRRRTLAARHRAVQMMLGGAAFPDVVAALTGDHGLDAFDAVVAAERAFRGSDGTTPGLGRERVYLETFLRVRAHLSAHPEDEPIVASGQVSADAVGHVRQVMEEATAP